MTRVGRPNPLRGVSDINAKTNEMDFASFIIGAGFACVMIACWPKRRPPTLQNVIPPPRYLTPREAQIELLKHERLTWGHDPRRN
jgi:hypothetical protein